MFTRQDYLHNKCTHEEYYAQFVDENVKRIVSLRFTEKELKESGGAFDGIPLPVWDVLASWISPPERAKIRALLKERGDLPSKAGYVCILKEAARQIIQ